MLSENILRIIFVTQQKAHHRKYGGLLFYGVRKLPYIDKDEQITKEDITYLKIVTSTS